MKRLSAALAAAAALLIAGPAAADALIDNVLGREAAGENGQQVSLRRSRSALIVF